MPTERDTRVTPHDRQFERRIGNALGYPPHPHYLWAWLDGDNIRQYPNWPYDLNVAWNLTKPYYFQLVPLIVGAGKIGCIATLMDDEGNEGRGEAAEPALAICRAFLALTDARPHEGG